MEGHYMDSKKKNPPPPPPPTSIPSDGTVKWDGSYPDSDSFMMRLTYDTRQTLIAALVVIGTLVGLGLLGLIGYWMYCLAPMLGIPNQERGPAAVVITVVLVTIVYPFYRVGVALKEVS